MPLTFDHIWLLPLSGDDLQVQGLRSRETDLTEDERTILTAVRARDSNYARVCHGDDVGDVHSPRDRRV